MTLPPSLLFLRYLYFLLGAINKLPKEPEGVVYRGVGPDAIKARQRAHLQQWLQRAAHT